jgi:hypothetical protein
MNIEKYKYLWDGSEEGWTLHHIDQVVWIITYLFSSKGPTKDEIIALHKLVPSFKDKSLSFVLKNVKCVREYKDEYQYGNIEAKRLEGEINVLGLNYKTEAVQAGSYLPVSKDNMALIIEDKQTSIAVSKKMLEAGVPVICHTHVD